MNILEINTERTWRGGERQTLYCVEGLLAAGATVELLCRAGSPLAQRAKTLACPLQVHTVPGQAAALAFLSRCGSGYDILHAQSAKSQTLAVLSRPFHRRPVVYTRRVDFVPHGLFTLHKYRQTDRIVAISEAIRQILVERGLGPVNVIPSAARAEAIDPAAVQRLRTDLAITEGIHLLGTTGSLVAHKDPLTMVRAIAALRALRGREDFLFLHLGDGALRSAVESEIHRLDLGRCYRLLGFVENVLPFFGLLEVFAMSSQEEGLGSSVLDAFLYNIPVASTAAGGLTETVSGRGLLSPPHSPEALAANLDTLLNDRGLGRTLADKAALHVRERHGLDQMSRAYLDLFDTLLAESGAARPRTAS